LFEKFEMEPIASASIAQVHRAWLKDGTQVAVKIQKPEIQTQIEFDLACYRLLLYAVEKIFDLPVYWSAQYVSEHVRQETDFINEAKNSEQCQLFLNETGDYLKNQVHVPIVYWDKTTKRVMTAEWIEGTSFADIPKLKQKYNPDKIMHVVVDVFADQIFRSGFVHCDPHPGNIIIRDNPKTGAPQVVLLDHGLYIRSSEKFRQEYCLFWMSLFTMDYDSLNKLSEKWGVPDLQSFATMTLARPWRKGEQPHLQAKPSIVDAFEIQAKAKDTLREFLKNSDRLPQELIFIGRNLNIVRGNNKALGSPVNRINIMANWAASSYKQEISTEFSYYGFFRSKINYFIFRSILFVGTLGFYYTRILHHIRGYFGIEDSGFEGILDDVQLQQMKEMFPGAVLDDSIFEV